MDLFPLERGEPDPEIIHNFIRGSTQLMACIFLGDILGIDIQRFEKTFLDLLQEVFLRIGEIGLKDLVHVFMGGMIVGNPDICIGFIDRIHFHLFDTRFGDKGQIDERPVYLWIIFYHFRTDRLENGCEAEFFCLRLCFGLFCDDFLVDIEVLEPGG